MGPWVMTRTAPIDGPRRLGWLTLMGAPALVAGAAYALTGYGIPCPVLLATGWLCPLCGASRMGAALLAGDLAEAWAWNPFALVLVTVLAAVWLWTVVRVAAKKPVQLPWPVAQLDRLRAEVWLMLTLAVALTFAVARNLS